MVRLKVGSFVLSSDGFLDVGTSLLSDDQPPRLIGSVNRSFAGFGREIFIDTGVYALRMDAASVAAEPGHLIPNTPATRISRPSLTSNRNLGTTGGRRSSRQTGNDIR
jgi:hypothetical protein